LDRLGFVPRADDTAPEANLRSSLIGSLGYMGNAKVLAEANRLFTALDSDPKAMDGPLRGTWLNIVANNADAATWEKLYQMAKTANSAVLQNTLYQLLGSAKDPVLAKRALDLALSGEPPATTAPGIIARVSAWHPDMAYDFVIANLDAVKAIVDGPSQSEFVANIGSSSDDPAMIGKLNAYADANLDAAARRPVDIAIVSIQTRQKNAAKEKADAAAWMDAKGM
jgi:ERAP1-like C-terminal domain